MGALRACELYPYGMIGVGNIFKDYKNEIIDSDDDVAVALDPDTLKPLSDSWINIKYNLEYATNDSIITHKQKDELLKIAKETYYPKRSFKYVIGKSNITNKDELLEYIKNKNFDIKYEDAKKTIEKIRKIKKY